MCNTNNGTERINEELKYEDLDRCTNFSLSELLTIIIEELLPRRYERYVEMNVSYTSGHKRYQSNIPKFLWNRPKAVVDDLLDKIWKVTNEMVTSVKPIPSIPRLTYLVTGEAMHSTEKTSYFVDFGDENHFVNCSCPWYRRNRSLCKHFFTVIKAGFCEFETLSPLYRYHPLNILDEDLFSSNNGNVVCNFNEECNQPLASTSDHEAELSKDSAFEEAKQNNAPMQFDDLPSRRRAIKRNKSSLLAKIKHLTELCYNIQATDQSSILEITGMVEEAISIAVESLEKSRENIAHTSDKPEEMEIKDDVCFESLPQQNNKHPFSGRVGQVADMMRQFYKAKMYLETSKCDTLSKHQSVTTNDEVVITKCFRKKTSSVRQPPKFNEEMEKEIDSGSCLSDLSINLSQYIILRQFSNLSGLEITQKGLSRSFTVQTRAFLQILFADAHWITVSAKGLNDPVLVYDSLNSGVVSRNFFHQITDLRQTKNDRILVEIMSVQQQTNTVDCGVYAIAYAVDIAHGKDPSMSAYDDKLMRDHLKHCLLLESFQPFPTLTGKRVKRCRSMKLVREVYCLCRRAYFDRDSDDDSGNFMAPCSVCGEWFHKSCGKIPMQVFKNDALATTWKCPSCI